MQNIELKNIQNIELHFNLKKPSCAFRSTPGLRTVLIILRSALEFTGSDVASCVCRCSDGRGLRSSRQREWM